MGREILSLVITILPMIITVIPLHLMIHYPSGRCVEYQYYRGNDNGANNQIKAVRYSDDCEVFYEFVTRVEWTLFGDVDIMEFANRVVTDYEYGYLGELLNLKATDYIGGGVDVFEYSYTYDGVDNLTAIEIWKGNTTRVFLMMR